MNNSTAPVGAADIVHSRPAQARLALSAIAQEVAHFAAGLVPTVSDNHGTAYEDVEKVARLVAAAQEVVPPAVVHVRERHGTWTGKVEVPRCPDVPATLAIELYTEVVEQWEDALNQPWERSGGYLSSRLPGDLSKNNSTIEYLDKWCARHVEDGGSFERVRVAGSSGGDK